jgi:hypothetical protein
LGYNGSSGSRKLKPQARLQESESASFVAKRKLEPFEREDGKGPSSLEPGSPDSEQL